ncbi:MAG: hypothetical protein BAJALOKI2v1_10037 [Promethearchaeota archaeon]|nr:MAG: hypothetical protein BAJALOKI2v1_10037 [Candidatus Lokiarchaeota archaeon]
MEISKVKFFKLIGKMLILIFLLIISYSNAYELYLSLFK